MAYAFVTLLTSDSYLPGALALAAALADLHPSPAVPPEVDFQTVCLVTPETVDVSAIKQLRRAFNVVVGVEVIAQEDEKGLRLLGRLDLNTVLTKLHVFRLTQYSKIIFLDADVLPIRPLSHLFTLPYEFSAVPDVGWPDIFNSGVLVLSPGEDKFAELNQLLKTKGTWDGGDQGILNEWRGNDWHRLSFTYNTTPTAAYTYAPAYERFGSQISAIHFIGPNKPWNSLPFRSPFQNHHSRTTAGPLQAYDYNTLLDRWFAVYDKHCRAQPASSETDFEVKRYISAWDEQTGTNDELILGSLTSGTALGLEDLRKIALEGMQASEPSHGRGPSEGEYIRLPLEGRIDLMRPHKLAEEKEEPQTPVDPAQATPRPGHTRSESSQRWENPSTPRPDEVPPSPQIPTISLPPTPTPASHAAQSQSNEPSQQHSSQQHSSQPDSSQQHPTQHHDDQHQNQQQPSHDQQHQQHQQRKEPPRPPSPPMLIWNPATEPPPKNVPDASAFPTNTYFPNQWDQSPRQQQQQQHHHHQQGTPPPNSNALFQPPPPSEIPVSLRREGHYRQVTGEETELGASPSPDRSKVKHVFPWEEKPRQMPGRVFPSSDAPLPSLFVGPGASPSPGGTPESAVSQARNMPLSPLQGLPQTLTYGNAWDSVPSIQRYASRLVRSPQSPQPLAPPFEGDRYRRGRSWDDRTEASSMDGDDEDDGEDEDDSLDGKRARPVPDSDDSDRETTRSSTTTAVRSRSRSSSISASYVIKGKKKEYRVRGVQTISPQMRSMGTQTEWPKVNTDAKRPRHDGRRQWTPSAADVVPPVTVHGGPDLSMTTASPSPVQPGSPREFLYATTSPSALRMTTPPPSVPATRSAPATERQPSNDGSLTSPPSSVGPISPPDAQLALSPPRKGSRVWDPARGVELFKRGSEEVLARFLKMGSWEDDARH